MCSLKIRLACYRVVRPRLHDSVQKGRVTAELYEVEVWATGVEGILLEPFLFLFGSCHAALLKRLYDFEFSPRQSGDFCCTLASMRQNE